MSHSPGLLTPKRDWYKICTQLWTIRTGIIKNLFQIDITVQYTLYSACANIENEKMFKLS